MYKKFIPYAHAQSVYEIDINFFKKMGIKYLLIDLDNTLDSYKAYHPNDRAKELIKNIRANGITPIIISNNRGKRVKSYATDLDVLYLNSARKPLTFKINKFLKKHNISKSDIILVGDQLLTDVLFANNAKIPVILTEKIVKEDQFTTVINRFLTKGIYKYHLKHGNFIDWRDK